MQVAALRCQIRPMTPGDIPQVLDIERQSFPSMWPQTVYQRELKNRMARYFVACEPPEPDTAGVVPVAVEKGVGGFVRRFFGGAPEARERILGLVGLWYMVGEAHIVTIAVRQELRRQGLGEVLLLAAIEAAMEAGQEEITLEYRISNDVARALYEKYGFRHVGVRARYYTDNNEDAVIMTTPPLRSPQYQRLLAERVAEQRARWGEGYPLEGMLKVLERATKRG